MGHGVKDFPEFNDVVNEKDGGITVSENFGLLIKHYRKLKNLSLKQLEEMSGVSASYVNRIENGERKSPSITKVLCLAESLQIPNFVIIKTLLGEKQEAENFTLSEVLINSDFLFKGSMLDRETKEILLKINKFLEDIEWNSSSKVRELYQLSELIDEFKEAI